MGFEGHPYLARHGFGDSLVPHQYVSDVTFADLGQS
jgi:hypothetical protein